MVTHPSTNRAQRGVTFCDFASTDICIWWFSDYSRSEPELASTRVRLFLLIALQSDDDSDSRHMTVSRSGAQKGAQSTAILIDFVSAKRRNMTSKAASRLQGRAKDLAATIECDSVYHSFFEHKPTKDYDNFIKNFGQSNMAQVSILSYLSVAMLRFIVYNLLILLHW